MDAITKRHVIQLQAEVLQGAIANRAFGQIEPDAFITKLLGRLCFDRQTPVFQVRFHSEKSVLPAFQNQFVRKSDRPASPIPGGVARTRHQVTHDTAFELLICFALPRSGILSESSHHFFMALDLPQPSSKLGGPLVKQFSVFLPNKVGALLDIVKLLSTRNAHVVALSISEST